MSKYTYLNAGNAAYVDQLYTDYRKDPESVESSWQKFFDGFDLGISAASDNNQQSDELSAGFTKEIKVLQLIDDYRRRGHLFTKTNPVRERRKHLPAIELQNFGLGDGDLDVIFQAGTQLGLVNATLRSIIEQLEETYSQSVGVEYDYIDDPQKSAWLRNRIEQNKNKTFFNVEEKKNILHKLNQANAFETFLHTKFVGQKRFSLEGSESFIPALDLIIEKGADLGVHEFTIGMGHRGRLNVLANVMQKKYKDIFAEFLQKNVHAESRFSGDVKYHLGYRNEFKTRNGKNISLDLSPNPSHLEAVDAVVQGKTRAKIDSKYNGNTNKIIPIIVHGDASLAGQGVVYEVLQMSKLKGYSTGGSIHIVINNQVGFTTDYEDARSSTYCTDLAKVVQAPVLHVNGDDAEAVCHVAQIALEYRQMFHEDIFIDLVSYRKYGHNEGDEPKFSQPTLYKEIQVHVNPKEIYAKKLISEGIISQDFSLEIQNIFNQQLQDLLEQVKTEDKILPSISTFTGKWENFKFANEAELFSPSQTAVSKDELKSVGEAITDLPESPKFLKKVQKLFESRKKSVETGIFDWAMGELLAYGTLQNENYPVRISGEDVERGTFSHRHAVLKHEETGERYLPLASLKGGAKFEIYNSLLSEYAVLGFDYGYALEEPETLVVWEAQFGDFANTAQVIIDQYIASAETKWQLSNGLVLLLPHGYEGQGPEHSSARIERFMELCADNNIQVVNCTTPANLFHVLRRQMHCKFKKPLIIFTPKSLLRHPKCISIIEEFTNGFFHELIDDHDAEPENVERVLLCSGKIYYDLLQKQSADAVKNVAIIRVEQLYPTPFPQIEELKKKYSRAKEWIWVQEEPENMGFWPYLCRKLSKSDLKIDLISRKESSSTATGYGDLHTTQQTAIIEQAFSNI
jgi:2-oxoglutarate dehydrogenase E1 component